MRLYKFVHSRDSANVALLGLKKQLCAEIA